jgi:pyruvate dehydrogenase E2 component (dihydrolipoamide acetyltransferase)
MVEVIRIPKLGLSEYADLVSWEVAVGESVAAGDVVAVLESEKASAEIESPASGVLLETYVAEGEEISVDIGRPLGVVGEQGETAPTLEELETDPDAIAAGDEGDGAGGEGKAGAGSDDSAPRAATRKVGGDDESEATDPGDVKATPRAKRDAEQEGVDLTAVEGTGPEGAVTSDDVERHLEATGGAAEAGAAGDEEPETEIKATPSAKREARERDVDLAGIEGTGPQGAITSEDVERYVESGAGAGAGEAAAGEAAAEGAAGASGAGGAAEATAEGLTVTESTELSGTRKTIAERLSRSAREKPHVMGTREIPIGRLEEARERLESTYDLEVSLNDLLLFFVGRVLEDLPEFNAHFRDGRHELIEEVNVGYAVDGPRGLTVPVVEGVSERSLADLAEQRRDLVQRVLADDHTVADLQGGTFTVTNVGSLGMDVSYSIINPPEVAILAVGRTKYAPVERDGEVDFERVITFSLTIDHRVLDGADSGAFLDRLAEYLEYPGAVFEEVSLD